MYFAHDYPGIKSTIHNQSYLLQLDVLPEEVYLQAFQVVAGFPTPLHSASNILSKLVGDGSRGSVQAMSWTLTFSSCRVTQHSGPSWRT